MAKFNRNKKEVDISALVADSVILTKWHGRTVVSKKPIPKRRRSNSPKQQQSIDQFRKAHAYAEGALKTAETLVLYTRGINAQKTSAHTVAFQDYLTPPVIHYIHAHNFRGEAGDVITVKATDDFRVQAVVIEVLDLDGKLLESGPAERYRRKPFIWKYKINVVNKDFRGITIQATATDLPGNETRMSVKFDDQAKNKKSTRFSDP